jgi:DNA-binding CsgD family transcriptional regulator/tetratricopeptide (TPR) repeat protein
MTPTAVPAPVALEDLVRATEESVSIARQMGWRPSEAYALSIQGFSLGPHGEFGLVSTALQTSLQISVELEHGFFIVTSRFALGAFYMDLLDFENARAHLLTAYSLAKQMGAGFVTGNIAGHLARTYLALNEMEQAEHVLQESLTEETPMNAESLRALWLGRAEWLLQKGMYEEARALIARMIQQTPHAGGEAVSPRLWLVHAQALRGLDRHADAESLLRAALHTALMAQLSPLVWRIHLELGLTLRAMRRVSEAQEQFSAARKVIDGLAGKISEDAMRESFLQRALPHLPNPSEKGKVKSEFGGLTERERGVAALVAGGLSNADIAERLVLSRRTVEAHVANILTKLSLRTRAQIAAWAVEKGLGREE